MNWINVKDKLPKNNELVFVMTDIGYCIEVFPGYFKKSHYGDGGDFLRLSLLIDGMVTEIDVTHWMPIPEAPKEGE